MSDKSKSDRPAPSKRVLRNPSPADPEGFDSPTVPLLEGTAPLAESEPPHRAGSTRIPERIGRYPILGKLGQGGMGVVFAARDERLDREVALKILTPELFGDPSALGRFEREARLLAALSHPNIAVIHSLEEDGETQFLTMELVPGRELAQILESGPLEAETALEICRQIALALEAAHAAALVHRDLKPQNVRVKDDGQVKVLDFGLAKRLHIEPQEYRTLEAGAVLGTPGYMSPEQLQRQSVDHRADIWALGCVLFECLVGQPAFPGRTFAERIAATLEREVDWGLLPESVRSSWKPLLEPCLRKRPDERPPNVAEVRSAIEVLLAHTRAGRNAERQGGPRRRPKKGNLPEARTGFVGRAKEISESTEAMRLRRLVTLTGPGGGGKTRLALELGYLLGDGFEDGVWLVELAPLREASLLGREIMSALGLEEQAQRTPEEIVLEYLSDREVLLIVDNCEHLASPVALVVRKLLSTAPRIRVLATSRSPLAVPGEHLMPVPQLSLPDREEGSSPVTPAHLAGFDAVRLFVDRARSANANFVLDTDSAPFVARICRQLDGLPLALELAAARAHELTLPQMEERLARRFQVLTSGRGSSSPHLTLRGAIDWSVEQLSDAERKLFSRLAVFRGGWDLEAAEGVTSDPAESAANSAAGTINAETAIAPWQILDLLGSLADKSLISMVAAAGSGSAGVARYRMLETIREYASELLEASAERDDVGRRHHLYFRDWAESAAPRLKGKSQAHWLARLALDHDNFRAVFHDVLSGRSEMELGVRLISALGKYWATRNHLNEGRRVCDQILEDGRIAAGADRARVLSTSAKLAWRQGALERARELGEEALSIWVDLGQERQELDCLSHLGNVAQDRGDYPGSRRIHETVRDRLRSSGSSAELATTLNSLGNISYMLGEHDRALEYYEESLAINRELGDPSVVAVSLNNVGNIAAVKGDFQRAREAYEESLGIFDQLRDQRCVAICHNNLGYLRYQGRELEDARGHYEKSLRLFRELGHDYAIGESLYNLGGVAFWQGDYDASRAFQQESLRLQLQLDNKHGLARGIEGLGILAQELERTSEAAMLLGAAEQLREGLDSPRSPAEDEEITRVLPVLRASLGHRFAPAWQEGRTKSLEEVVRVALRI